MLADNRARPRAPIPEQPSNGARRTRSPAGGKTRRSCLRWVDRRSRSVTLKRPAWDKFASQAFENAGAADELGDERGADGRDEPGHDGGGL